MKSFLNQVNVIRRPQESHANLRSCSSWRTPHTVLVPNHHSHPWMWRHVLFIGLAAALASGKLIFSPADLEYDFIVVGACLWENPDVKVLAIEAGGSNENIIATIASLTFLGVSLLRLTGTSVDWNYTTVPLEGYNM
ncbi:hypothetical protein BDZ89DRAFT_388244 [Hymenopellis radicata]|nr:hypothetical protein BDZ89DRAFT_388244 [Hymenopellis radicata]